MNTNKNVIVIGVEVDPEKSYRIEDVSLLTGYTTGYIRNLERAKKIPIANRDVKGWRTWVGSEVALIVEYCRQHHALGSKNLISNKPKEKEVL
jgi:hypothetical protein